MVSKTVIGMLLGLVLQLVQILPCTSFGASPGCGGEPEMPASCCQGYCPCAKNSSSRERPAPLAPPTNEVKAQAMVPFEDAIAPALAKLPQLEPTLRVVASHETIDAYPGVKLAVAYCSFQI